jgi:hypothetical protein
MTLSLCLVCYHFSGVVLQGPQPRVCCVYQPSLLLWTLTSNFYLFSLVILPNTAHFHWLFVYLKNSTNVSRGKVPKGVKVAFLCLLSLTLGPPSPSCLGHLVSSFSSSPHLQRRCSLCHLSLSLCRVLSLLT